MYDNHFSRVEEKYLIDENVKNELLKRMKKYLAKDKFYETEIHNIYFDNDNNDLIINSLEKPIFKYKFRVRSYGLPDKKNDVFLEMKTKYKNIVGKRRIKISLEDYNKYLNKNYTSDNQIFKEIDYYIKTYDLFPKIYIIYNRFSYIGKDNKDLRITFDYNLRSRRDNLYFKKEENMTKYFNDNYYIMEIKTNNAMPLWLVTILSELKIIPISFSKYGKIYLKEMKEND